MDKRIWTESELNYIRDNYHEKSASTIANHLKRSIGSIQQKAFKLGVCAINRSGVKTIWSYKDIQFLKDNYLKMKTEYLSNILGITYTVVRMKMAELGLRKCNNAKWQSEWDTYLIENFRFVGDVELAEIFEMKFPKSHKWTPKQISKRRTYLNLYRTREEVKAISIRNTMNGRFSMCAIKRWEKTGQFEEGTVRFWHYASGLKFAVIKINGIYVHQNRYVWEQHFGEIPKGMAIVHKNGNSTDNRIENLEMITLEENIKRNSVYNLYPKELVKDIIALGMFQKKLRDYEKQKQ